MKALAILALLWVGPVQMVLPVHQPTDPDAEWMNSLSVPGIDPSSHAGSCCGANPAHPDCRVMDDADVRSVLKDGRFDHYSVRDTNTDRWLDVDPRRVSQRMDNPTGHFVACIHEGLGVMCFFNRTGI
jgi:hypothetical protein